jgi:hypothetical protein
MKGIFLFFILVGAVLTEMPAAKSSPEEDRAKINACIKAGDMSIVDCENCGITHQYDCYKEVAYLISRLNRQQVLKDSQRWGGGWEWGSRLRVLKCKKPPVLTVANAHCWVIVSE